MSMGIDTNTVKAMLVRFHGMWCNLHRECAFHGSLNGKLAIVCLRWHDTNAKALIIDVNNHLQGTVTITEELFVKVYITDKDFVSGVPYYTDAYECIDDANENTTMFMHLSEFLLDDANMLIVWEMVKWFGF